MSNYFSKFPLISYNGVSVRDITKRVNFIQTNLNNPYIFLPYTVKEGEKPEDIAFHYYGTVDATWLVLMANGIVDPYTGWPMAEDVFSNFIIKKYEALSNRIGYNVLSWTQDETRFDNVHSYYKKADDGSNITISPNTFDSLSTDSEYTVDEDFIITDNDVQANYTPYRFYQYEMDLNNNKREILIVDSSFYGQIEKEFKTLIRT